MVGILEGGGGDVTVEVLFEEDEVKVPMPG
jgi:hypothetical protein